MKNSLENLVELANSGDQKALESIMNEIKDFIYNVSLKMLLYPEEAQDATQEILIKVLTHLSTFNYESQFKTWVYRITTNYLLTYKNRKTKTFAMPFADYEKLIDAGQSDVVNYTINEGETFLLEEEVKVSCTQGLLLCLNVLDRMVYVLAVILEFNSREGAEVLEITPENFRKKLSRSKTKIRNFLNNKCGLANPKNPCRCNKKIDFLINKKIINPKDLRFAHFSKRSIDVYKELGELEISVAIYRSVPQAEAPDIIYKKIKQVLELN